MNHTGKRHRIVLLIIVVSILAALTARADVITDWNIKAGEIVVDAGMATPVANRAMAIVHTAVYEAVNAITRRYPDSRLRLKAAAGASVEAAVAAANHATLANLAPSQQAAIDNAYRAALAMIADGPAKTEGIAVGERAAAAILALRADDGADAIEAYRPYTTAGVYVPTVIPVVSQWPQRKPWLMTSPPSSVRGRRPGSRASCGRATTTRPNRSAERTARAGHPSRPKSPSSGRQRCLPSITESCALSPICPDERLRGTPACSRR